MSIVPSEPAADAGSEQRFRTLASHAPVGIFLCDAQGNTVFVNETWCRLTGLSPEDALGSGWLRALHPEDRDRVREGWNQALLAGTASEAEFRFLRSDGSVVWLQGSASQVRERDGSLSGYVGTVVDVTVRKRSEESALRQAERLSLAVAAGDLGDWSWDLASDEMLLSSRSCDIFGVTAGARITRTEMRAMLHPDDRLRAQRANEQSLADGTDYDLEYRVRHPRTGWRWIAARGRVLAGPDGRPRGMIGVLQDITTRKEVETRLQEREAELRLISNSAPVMLVHCDLQGRYLFVNRAYSERFGLPPEALLGRQIGDVIGPAAFAAIRPYMERVLRGERVEFEIAIPYARLGVRYMRAAYVPDFDADGAVRSWLSAITDLTERRAAEETLRARTRTLEILNTVSSALVAEHDPERIVQVVSEAAREISGAAFGGFRRFDAGRTNDPAALPFERSGVLRIADARQSGAAEAEALARWGPAGTEVRSYLAVPVVSRSGEVLGGLFFGHAEPNRFDRDSERTLVGLAAEAAIAMDTASVYRTLEQRVQERTTSLREAIGQMEEFSYSVSHDLRAPLRAMNGYAQALLDDYGGRLDATAVGYLERIQRSSQRMEKLTYDLLTYSRIARTEVRPTTVNLDKLIADLVNQYVELQAPRSRIEIAGPLGDVRGHESSLAQAAANLLTNAVKFVPAGTQPRVRVWATSEHQRIRLWVQDNGIGIKPEHRGRLFQVFERLPTGERFEGTGIGLAIVRKAMEKMGGACGVDSDGRSGSRFWLELPKATMGQ